LKLFALKLKSALTFNIARSSSYLKGLTGSVKVTQWNPSHSCFTKRSLQREKKFK